MRAKGKVDIRPPHYYGVEFPHSAVVRQQAKKKRNLPLLELLQTDNG